MPEVNLTGDKVVRTNSVKYPELIFCRSLCFIEHIEQVTIKMEKRLAAMRAMAVANIDQRLLVLLYHALIPSVINHALPIVTAS